MNYRPVKSVEGLECTSDGLFRYKGKEKKAIRSHTVTGRKATARVNIVIRGKMHYWQAAKLIAETWCRGYDDGSYITYKDGNCHNIVADNLEICGKKEYWKYMQRNSGYHAETLEERKRKLELIIAEATMTLNYFKTKDMTEINKHVTSYLYPCLMRFCLKTLYLGERTAMDAVPEVIGNMYEAIMNGSAVHNYERFCKKQLHNLKKTGKYGEYWQKLIKPIKIEVEQLKLDCLWEKYKVQYSKKN